MTANINQCRDRQLHDQWIEIRLVDEMNQPFGSMDGILTDSAGSKHNISITGGYLLFLSLPAGPVRLNVKTSSLLDEAKKHKQRPYVEGAEVKIYAEKILDLRKQI